MALDTYANLQASIAEFLNRQDLTATIPDFIRLAESQMERELEHWRMEKRATASLTDRYTALPTDFLSPKSLYVTGDRRALEAITQQDMQEYRYASADATGKPRYYCITAGEIELYPTPTEGTLEMYYLATLPALSDANTSNWLLAEAPDAYLYGSLLQSAPYLEDDQRIQVWTSLYLAAVTALNAQSQRAKWGGQSLVRKFKHG